MKEHSSAHLHVLSASSNIHGSFLCKNIYFSFKTLLITDVHSLALLNFLFVAC